MHALPYLLEQTLRRHGKTNLQGAAPAASKPQGRLRHPALIIDDEGFELLHAGGVRNLRLRLTPSVFSLKFSFSLISRHSTSRLELISPLYTQAHTLIRSGVRPSANARSSLRSQRDVRAPRKRPSWRPCSSRLTHTAPCTRQLRAEAREPLRTSRAPSSMPDTALHVRYGARCPIRRCVLLLSRDTPETAPSSPKP